MSVDHQNIQMADELKRKQNMMKSLDTWAKLRKHQETKIRDYYFKVFKNENNSLAKQGIIIRSNINTLSKTRKKQGFKIPAKKLTLKAVAETIITKPVSSE